MADIFISYARADRPRIEKLAAALEAAGYGVWWDRHIDGGAEFSKDIEAQIEAAKAVIVAWSAHSVESEWVRDEAALARDSDKLIPIALDTTLPPIGFRQRQSIDMRDASGEGALLRSIAHRLGGEEPPMPSRTAGRFNFRHIAVALAVVFVAAAVAFLALRGGDGTAGRSEEDRLALAIMPLSTMQEETGFIAFGLPISLGNGLEGHADLQLIAPSSTRAVAADGLTANQIGERLGATHLIEGDVVQAADQRLIIDLRLVETKSSRLLWSRQYRFADAELSRQQNIMGRDVAIALSSRLGLNEARFDQLPEIDPRAYAAYLRGLENMIGRDRPGARAEAVEQFRLATSIEPEFAPAYAGEAFMYAASPNHILGITRIQRIERYRKAIAQALRLDPENGFARATALSGALNVEGRLEGLSEQAEQLVRDAPNQHLPHYVSALLLEVEGRVDAAAKHYDHAIALNPADRTVQFWSAKMNLLRGDYDGIRRFALSCDAECWRPNHLWFVALASFGTKAQVENDWPALKTRLEVDYDSPSIEALEQTLFAIVDPREASVTPATLARAIKVFADTRNDIFVPVALRGKLGSFDEALSDWKRAWETYPLDMLQMLTPGRLGFSKAQRADPRYHALFEPRLAREMAEHRREHGLPYGLPVFPRRPYERGAQ